MGTAVRDFGPGAQPPTSARLLLQCFSSLERARVVYMDWIAVAHGGRPTSIAVRRGDRGTVPPRCACSAAAM